MKYLLIVVSLTLITSCNNNPKANIRASNNKENEIVKNSFSNDCANLPKSFGSYDEAVRIIKETHFTFQDNVITASSSWIRGANYYSCDNQIGYFLLYTDKQDYIYKDLPIDVWNGFKTSSSFGSFYNQSIKNRYQLYLTEEK